MLTLPIINQPQVAILSTDGDPQRPVVVDGPTATTRSPSTRSAYLALTWDHRAFDGAYAAAFLAQGRRKILETRDWEAEL